MQINYLSSIVLGLSVIALLFPALIACCCQSNENETNVSREELLDEIASLDRVHVAFVRAQILRQFGVARAPRRAKRWRQRMAENDRADSEEMFHQQMLPGFEKDRPKPRQPVRLSIFGKVSKVPNNATCAHSKTDAARIVYKVHRAHGTIHGLQLVFPEYLREPPNEQGSNEARDEDDSGISHSSTELEGQQDEPLQLTLRYVRVDSTDEQVTDAVIRDESFDGLFPTTVDLSSDFQNIDISPSAHFELLVNTDSSAHHLCSIYRFLAAHLPVLQIEIIDPIRSRDYRSIPDIDSGHLIGECDVEWDRRMLVPDLDRIQDDFMPCCRRRVRIDFAALGWDDWIIAPRAFDSYYCVGRCRHFGGVADAGAQGAAIYSEIMNRGLKSKFRLTPCCSPVQFAPLTVIAVNGPNEQMTQSLEDIIVRNCGCM